MLVPVFASRSTALHSSSGGYSVFISCSAPGLPHPGCVFYSLAIPWPTSLEGCCFLPTTGSQKGVVLKDKWKSQISGEGEWMGVLISKVKASRHRTKTPAGSFFSVYICQGNRRDQPAFLCTLRLHLDQASYKGWSSKLFAIMSLQTVVWPFSWHKSVSCQFSSVKTGTSEGLMLEYQDIRHNFCYSLLL